MKLVSFAIEATVALAIDCDDPKEAARSAEAELRRDPLGRPMTVLSITPIMVEDTEVL